MIHARRLRGMAAFQAGDVARAAAEFQQESVNAPFSVINANFNCILLSRVSASPEVTAAAHNQLENLCLMRGITPETASAFRTDADDAPFSKRLREEFWR